MTGPTCDYKMNPFSGQRGNTNELTVMCVITGTEDLDSAQQALFNFLPPRLGPLYMQTYKASPVAPDVWDGEATYGTTKPNDQPTFSIEIGVATAHFTQSLQNVGRYGSGGPVPNFRGAIGATKDGVEGCDVNVPSMTWSEHHLLGANFVTQSYLQTVFNCTARMNASQFRIFNPGEALLIGATLAPSPDRSGWTGDFRWIGSPNGYNIAIGAVNVAQKLGHDYLWVKYNEAASNGVMVKIPKYVFVERVYQFGDMDSLLLDDPT